jgi:hypothetical protein
MRRRRLLGAVAAGFGASAGCLDRVRRGVDPSTDETTTADATEDRPSYAALTVERATATPEYVASNSPDSVGTYGDRGEQYVIASVAAEGTPAPPPSEFALAAGGETFAPDGDVGGMGERLWNYDGAYGREGAAAGWIAFEVPKPLDAEDAAITWPGGEYALDDRAVERLSQPPTDFEVKGFDAPETMELDETVTATLTVENVGDADGRFVAAVNRTGPRIAYTPEATLSLDVPAGETATWEYESGPGDRYADPADGAEGQTMIVRLQWRDGSLSREIEVETSAESSA